MISNINLDDIVNIAKKASIQVMEIYNTNFDIEYKDDLSPLTKADLAANNIICNSLISLYPNIPILSEENKEIDYNDRKKWKYYWCIDPIDGTKEFIKKNGEFTINIALLGNNIPILGVVYAPVQNILYKAKKGIGAYKNDIKLPIKKEHNKYIILASRSHLSSENIKFIDNIKTTKEKQIINIGSSLKLCLIAEGAADIYPRLSPTKEWDTAAADAIVIESGKQCLQYDSSLALKYNKPNLLNPWFIVQ